MGIREAAPDVDFSAIQLDQDLEDQVKEASVVSMGTEISKEDMTNIVELCDQASLPACLRSLRSVPARLQSPRRTAQRHARGCMRL